MADRESILRWLKQKSFRRVRERDPARRIVERLVEEGRAAWVGHDMAAITFKGYESLKEPR